MGADLRPWRSGQCVVLGAKLKVGRNMQEYCRNAQNTTMTCRIKVLVANGIK